MKILKLTDLDGWPRVVVICGPVVIDPVFLCEAPEPFDEEAVRAQAPGGLDYQIQDYVDRLREAWKQKLDKSTANTRFRFFVGRRNRDVFVRETFAEIERLLMDGPK